MFSENFIEITTSIVFFFLILEESMIHSKTNEKQKQRIVFAHFKNYHIANYYCQHNFLNLLL